MPYLLGIDAGSSSIKASLVDQATGLITASAQSPSTELQISAPQPGWAEQDPELWWEHVLKALAILQEKTGKLSKVGAVGISYQMHGLVAVDKDMNPLRPSIIWCDSRASSLGEKAFKALGRDFCLSHLLNSPGNFTAAKLAWVKENQPDIYSRIYKVMLPGDYIGMKLTGLSFSTSTGYSEGILWDYTTDAPSNELIDYYGFSPDIFPDIVPVFGNQGTITRQVSRVTGLTAGVPVTYRAGDQPNNALSLNVLEPGEVAATAGTSGVIYGILDRVNHDPLLRVNVFAHVNHLQPDTRLGVLLCINGTGILYSWIRKLLQGSGLDYPFMNKLAAGVEPGSDGLLVFPFGNGVERIHQNKPFGGRIINLDLNRHSREHLIRAAQEGIVYALMYGFEAMQEMGVRTETVKAGNANLFLSPVFREIFADVTRTTVELYNTDGAAGAARGAGIGAGIFAGPAEAFRALSIVEHIKPNPERHKKYTELYNIWKKEMLATLK
ncbi:MAG TPA: carbohydrate kinase [Bacteroidales bacterium]|nr:carbohydrate kinase [Bacteroidales bacterium]